MAISNPVPQTPVSKADWGDAITDEVNLATEHRLDGTDAHPASAITNTPAGVIAAVNVQQAIDELATEKAPLASPTFTGVVVVPRPGPSNSAADRQYVDDAMTNHQAGGHNAFNIYFQPTATVAATNVQMAIQEVAAEAGTITSINGNPGPAVSLSASYIPMQPLTTINANEVQTGFAYVDWHLQQPGATGLVPLVVTSDWTHSDSYIERIGHTVNMYLSVSADGPVPADVAVLTLPQGFRPARGGVNGQWVLDGIDVRTATEVTELSVFASWATSEPWPPENPPTNPFPD